MVLLAGLLKAECLFDLESWQLKNQPDDQSKNCNIMYSKTMIEIWIEFSETD